MQRLKKISEKLWTIILLVYSLSIFAFSETPASLTIFVLPFYIFIPGYASVVILFPRLDKLEKALMSVALSLALFTGISALMRLSGVTGLISEHLVLTIFSAVCLILKLFPKKY